jgi:hypothetical protein
MAADIVMRRRVMRRSGLLVIGSRRRVHTVVGDGSGLGFTVTVGNLHLLFARRLLTRERNRRTCCDREVQHEHEQSGRAPEQ